MSWRDGRKLRYSANRGVILMVWGGESRCSREWEGNWNSLKEGKRAEGRRKGRKEEGSIAAGSV